MIKKTMEIQSRVRAATVLCFAVMAAICMAQSSSGNQTGLQTGGQLPASSKGPSPLGPAGGIDNTPSPFPDNSNQKRNEERQRRLESDTLKLVALTSQLKAEVASTGAETMSPEMLKQMAEIEKLARSVKDKMRE